MKVKCPFCGAEFDAPPLKKMYVCPYCGTVVSEGKTAERVYIFKPSVDKTTAFRNVLNFRPVASPDDLPAASPTSAELHFLPIYIYRVTFYPLRELESDVAVSAINEPPFTLPRDFKFPARWRTPFKPSLERQGIFHSPDLDIDEAFQKLRELVEEARTYASVFKAPVEVNYRFLGMAYYPFWVLEYSYLSTNYRAVVDAAEGSVLYMEYPLSERGRIETLGLAAAISFIAGLIGAGAASFFGLPAPLGGLGGALSSGGAALRLLRLAVAERGRYEAEVKL